jgi:hypothetical protein
MRIQQILAFIGAATLSVSALADPSIASSASAASGTPGQVQPSLRYRLTKDEAQHMRGAFGLADGRTMTVTNRLAKLYMELDGKCEELVPVGLNKFVTRETGTRVTFNQVPYADEVVVDQAVR